MFTKTRKNLIAVSLIGLAALSTGCKTAPVMPVTSNFNPTVLTHEFETKESKISKHDVMSAIGNSLEKGSGIRTTYRYGSPTLPKVAGLSTSWSCKSDLDCLVSMTFINGEQYTTQRRVSVQKIHIPVALKINENSITAKVSITGKSTFQEGTNPFMSAYDALLSPTELEKVLNGLAGSTPRIKFIKSYSKETDIDTTDTIVFSNLKRTYGLYKFASDQEKNKIGKKTAFNLKTDTGVTPLVVEIFPTRSGAAIEYSFKQSYIATPDGKTTYNLKEANALEASIVKVASK